MLCVPTVHIGPQRPKCRGKMKTLLRLASEEKNLECNAIYQVVDHLVRFAKCQSLDMLVLYNYEYGNYLKNIWKEVTKMTGDHDVMAICQWLSVNDSILCESLAMSVASAAQFPVPRGFEDI